MHVVIQCNSNQTAFKFIKITADLWAEPINFNPFFCFTSNCEAVTNLLKQLLNFNIQANAKALRPGCLERTIAPTLLVVACIRGVS